MSLQPGSKRLLPFVADLRFPASSADACLLTDDCRLLALSTWNKMASAFCPWRFLITPAMAIWRQRITFWNMKGRQKPTGGQNLQTAENTLAPQRLPLAKPIFKPP